MASPSRSAGGWAPEPIHWWLLVCAANLKGVVWQEMVRKATLPFLLLLLLSVQTVASACEVRCATMTAMNSAGRMASMAHCQGMASRSLASDRAGATVTPVQACVSHICKYDWAFQSRAVPELGLSPLSAAVHSVATMPTPIAICLRWKTDRSTNGIPIFDPLMSSLRV